MIVDGRAEARHILAQAQHILGRSAVVRAVVVAPSPATDSYLSIKAARAKDAGMELVVVRLPDDATTEMVSDAVRAPGADAVIVQLPLPPHIAEQQVLDAIPLAQDADVLSAAAVAAFEQGGGLVVPPVAAAVVHILTRAGQWDLREKQAAVVGQGRLVGRPVAAILRMLGATVTVCTRESPNLQALRDADIVVSGAGVPGLIKPDHLKQGVILIDAGTSEQGGVIVGDADPACATIASVFTPVPGGVGPIAVACLFRNVAELLASPLPDDTKRVD